MPLAVFQYVASNTSLGDTGPIAMRVSLKQPPPPGTRFWLKQVTALDVTSVSTSTSLRSVDVLIPQLMTDNDRVMFSSDTVSLVADSFGTVTPGTPFTGIRYYVTQGQITPIQVHETPMLNLGKHHQYCPFIDLILTPRDLNGTVCKLMYASIILEFND